MSEMPTGWWWRASDTDGAEVAPEDRQDFPTRGDAESWLGEAWEELVDSGADAVTLFEGEREVYGPMSLRPE
ncbi:MAG TPA: hypothetical protein VF426_02795 [Marmoricola sp.]